MQNFTCKSPVLLIAFNRPETTAIVFNAIRKAEPEKLYVAVDGSRESRKEDVEDRQKVLALVKEIDWPCTVRYQISEKNQGCGSGSANAITWIFENEDRAIILEDDCVPAISFFKFCDELLERYLNVERIGIISGNNINKERTRDDYSYMFCRYAHSWGWATWKRTWNHFDFEMKNYLQFEKEKQLENIFETQKEISYYRNFYKKAFYDSGFRSHVWDFQFSFSLLSTDKINIVPKKNLVSNIGYTGTHSGKKTRHHDISTDESFIITQHPVFIIRNMWYDDYHFTKHIYRDYRVIFRLYNYFFKAVRKIKRFLKLEK